jgi:hypothetical protein
MAHRSSQPNGSSHLRAIAPSASPEETAAIVAAIERFRRATSSHAEPQSTDQQGWLRAAILEGVSRQPQGDTSEAWINT